MKRSSESDVTSGVSVTKRPCTSPIAVKDDDTKVDDAQYLGVDHKRLLPLLKSATYDGLNIVGAHGYGKTTALKRLTENFLVVPFRIPRGYESSACSYEMFLIHILARLHLAGEHVTDRAVGRVKIFESLQFADVSNWVRERCAMYVMSDNAKLDTSLIESDVCATVNRMTDNNTPLLLVIDDLQLLTEYYRKTTDPVVNIARAASFVTSLHPTHKFALVSASHFMIAKFPELWKVHNRNANNIHTLKFSVQLPVDEMVTHIQRHFNVTVSQGADTLLHSTLLTDLARFTNPYNFQSLMCELRLRVSENVHTIDTIQREMYNHRVTLVNEAKDGLRVMKFNPERFDIELLRKIAEKAVTIGATNDSDASDGVSSYNADDIPYDKLFHLLRAGYIRYVDDHNVCIADDFILTSLKNIFNLI